MNQIFDAVFEQGVFRPLAPPDLREGERVKLTVTKAPVDVENDPLLALSGFIKTGPIDGALNHDKYIGEALYREMRGLPDE